MTNKNKINSILDMMDDLLESLLALPDDILLSIYPAQLAIENLF